MWVKGRMQDVVIGGISQSAVLQAAFELNVQQPNTSITQQQMPQYTHIPCAKCRELNLERLPEHASGYTRHKSTDRWISECHYITLRCCEVILACFVWHTLWRNSLRMLKSNLLLNSSCLLPPPHLLSLVLTGPSPLSCTAVEIKINSVTLFVNSRTSPRKWDSLSISIASTSTRIYQSCTGVY